jgi:hypothetical protein
MTQEDYKIREGLIALMCVGDPIRNLDTEMIDARRHGRLPKGTAYDLTNIVSVYTITEIYKEQNAIKICNPFNEFYQSMSMIDEYNGHLYIWNADLKYGENEYEKRMEKLISLLESKHTKYIV